ncbi:AraC family transcriptional regulator [Novosphingobium endophyticum]|uniref:AraC family transcriptional regulator n=1 Tax=Novosphingobium endophyticum TaxID=1955250 RepID=A0A916X6G7_9SPHN|nr:helix-turn-helix domain-containing protein [Novosphingobium endophyticum]GGC08713.1 AraC family transcriptional regulator [Novosphingobium endophyticum]
MPAPSAIPTYVLYGEELSAGTQVFAHIETIAVRSSLHDWEISPHRHTGSVQVILVSEGQVDFLMDKTRKILRAPCHMVIPIGSVHGFRFEPDTQGHVLTLSAGFAGRCDGAEDPMLRLLSHGAGRETPTAVQPRVDWLCREMLSLEAQWHAPQPLFLALAEALVRSLGSEEGEDDLLAGGDRRLSRFRELVEIHLSDHLPVSRYAQVLGMTTKTLTRLCRRELGRTPLDVIHTRLALEAQRLLCFTNVGVAQVSDELGFSDPSYFSRFYLRMTGRRPQQDKSAFSGGHQNDA